MNALYRDYDVAATNSTTAYYLDVAIVSYISYFVNIFHGMTITYLVLFNCWK